MVESRVTLRWARSQYLCGKVAMFRKGSTRGSRWSWWIALEGCRLLRASGFVGGLPTEQQEWYQAVCL